MDVNTHVRAIWRHRWTVLLGALAVGLVVLGVRLTAPTTWTTSATLYLVPAPDADPADTARLTEVYVALADNRLVLLSTAANADVDPATALGATSLELVSDGLLRATGSSSSAARAAALTNAYGGALSRAVELDQRRAQQLALAPLDAQLASVNQQLASLSSTSPGFDSLAQQRASLASSRAGLLSRSLLRLDVLAAAEARDAVRRPAPVRDALFAFLVALIVLAELVVVRAVRQGRLDGLGVEGSLEQLSGLMVLRVGTGTRRGQADQSAALLSLVLASDAEPHAALLLPLDPTPAARAVAPALAAAVVRAGRRPVLVDVGGALSDQPVPTPAVRLDPATSPDRSGDAPVLPGTNPRDVVVVALPSWDSPELLALGALPALTVLVVDARQVRRRSVQEALRVLALADRRAELVIVTEQSGRRRRRRRDGSRSAPDGRGEGPVETPARPVAGIPAGT